MKWEKYVWVEVSPDLMRVVRIFKSKKAAQVVDAKWMPYGVAVGSIRRQLFCRSHGYCEMCAKSILESSGHMHEKVHRGKGGEISLDNSIFICPPCHAYQHRERNPQWTKKSS